MAELPEELQDLVRRYVKAGILGRKARCAELQGRAIDVATRVYGADSLVVAHLLVERAHSLRAELLFAMKNGDGDSCVRLAGEAWKSARTSLATLDRRRRDGTLLPGCCQPEEVALRQLEMASCANGPQYPPALLAVSACAVGVTSYWTAAMSAELVVLVIPQFVAAGIRVPPDLVNDFELANRVLLSALDLLAEVRLTLYPQPAGVELCGDLDANLDGMSLSNCPAALRPLFRKRAEPAVADAFARLAAPAQHIATTSNVRMQAAEDADRDKHGLKACASCAVVELTVRTFKVCSRCRSVAYCCAAHQAAHWPEHKRDCKRVDDGGK